jgi:hypothetical protein
MDVCHLMELSVKDVSSLFTRCPRLVYNVVQVGEAQLDEAVANNSDQARDRVHTTTNFFSARKRLSSTNNYDYIQVTAIDITNQMLLNIIKLSVAM